MTHVGQINGPLAASAFSASSPVQLLPGLLLLLLFLP